MAGLKDHLATTKLLFFASIIDKTSKKHPFMYQNLKALIKSLLKLIAKPSIIKKCKSGAQMTKLGISNSSILLDARNIKMGFAP